MKPDHYSLLKQQQSLQLIILIVLCIRLNISNTIINTKKSNKSEVNVYKNIEYVHGETFCNLVRHFDNNHITSDQ